tara:strand:- start:401 stop:3046 length:2646 start_codon:yes stop_codon:yes gene_type:complete
MDLAWRILIKTRIYTGFVVLTSFIVIVSLISFQGIKKTDDSFLKYDAINQQSKYIVHIDNSFSNLTRGVQDYIYTGYEAIADHTFRNLSELKIYLRDIKPFFSNNKAALDYLARIEKHLAGYHQGFSFAVEERVKRESLIEELFLLEEELINNVALTESSKSTIIHAENVLLKYLDDPDILETNAVIAILDKQIKILEPGWLKNKIIEYKTKYIEVIQSTRGFLFLISVVVPTEAQEVRYISRQFNKIILSQFDAVRTDLQNEKYKTRSIIIFTTIILIILALLFSFIISNSINRPLFRLKKTFDDLANDRGVTSIPGLELKDEIGEMAKAAEIFRQKNEATKKIATELDKKKSDLESSNQELERSSIELAKTSQFLEGILVNAVNGIISINKTGEILSVNPATERLFGYSQEEMLGQNVKVLMPASSHDEHESYFTNYLEVDRNKVIGTGHEIIGLCKDGSTFPMELAVSENKSGDHNSFTVIIRDISESVNKQKEIEDQKFYYENILENLNVPVFIINTEHEVILWNKAIEILTGVSSSEILGTSNHQKVIYKDERLVFADLVLDGAFDRPESYPVDLIYPVDIEESLMPGGKRAQNWVDFPRSGRPAVYLTFDAGPIYDREGNVLAVAQVMQDITTMKNMEESIKVNNELLLRSNEELEQFAYIASHDLQEPLRMVASYTSLLAVRYKDKLDEDANDFINYAVDGAKRMQNLINDLLSFSRLNTKGRKFSIIDTDKLCQDVINDLNVSITEHDVVVSKDELPHIKGDEVQIRQLFQNLISNAIKYSDPKRKNKIHISVALEHDNYKFIITDNGIGIAQEYFEKIFIIFKRLHGKEVYSGSGIGLSICKKIVELHGGIIGLESKLGQGSSFYFTLPGDL